MWKDCINGYKISSVGEVKNIISGKILKHSLNSRGFHRVTIKNKHYAVHRLIAIAFIPNPKQLPNVIFKDADKEHFSLTNIEWSIEQNMTALQYTQRRKYKNIKLTEGMVKVIKIYNKRMTNKKLADMYKVSVSTIYAVNKGKNMKRFIDLSV